MASNPDRNKTFAQRAVRRVLGAPHDLRDPHVFHKLSLIPLLAWIGLGADGLSSSSYGPEEAFRALGSHTYLAVFLAAATAVTVGVISYTYSRIIEHFPHGGGGYIVATHMLGEKAGVISGCCADRRLRAHDYGLHHFVRRRAVQLPAPGVSAV